MDPVSPSRALPVARRAALAELVVEALGVARTLAEHYARFAGRAPLEPLRAALEALARETAAQVGVLEALGRAFGVDVDARASKAALPLEPPASASRPEDFGVAFQGERALDSAYREIVALLGVAAPWPAFLDLAAAARRRQRQLRELYLRYS